MGGSRATGWVLTALLALGLALVVYPFLPAPWPNPLPAQFADDDDASLPQETVLANASGSAQVRQRLQALENACRRGDVAAFRELVTPRFAQDLARRLQPLGRAVDEAALREYADGAGGLGFDRLAAAKLLQGAAAGSRAATVVGEREAVRGLEWTWDGQVLRLDAIRVLPTAAAKDARMRGGFADAVLQRK